MDVAAARARLAALKTEAKALEREIKAAAGHARSPLAPGAFPELPVVRGARFAAAAAGVRYAGRDDVMLALLDPGTAVAAVLATSATRAEPVRWCERLRALPPAAGAQAILVNAGNANAFTGGAGVEAVAALAAAASRAAGTASEAVWIASTGVIGEPLPHERIEAVLDRLVEAAAEDGADAAARAIMTTDTFPKGAGETLDLGGARVAVAGFCKGSGMIAPDMATMLAFVFTDAPVAREVLQAMLGRLADRSFNCVTVDGDASTSDTLLLAATGGAGGAPIAAEDDPRLTALEAALGRVMADLAQQVARDGEGATKLLTVRVTGAVSDASARRVAKAIAESPLVKTAAAGEDPNWGRVVMAIGKAGEPAERDRLTIRFGDVLVAERGAVAPGYREEEGAAAMRAAEIGIEVDLGLGEGAATVWGCDLTHGYVDINADYRS